MTTRRDFLAGAFAATSALTLSRTVRAQGAARTGKIGLEAAVYFAGRNTHV